MKASFIGKTSMGFVTWRVYNIKSEMRMVRNGVYPFYNDKMCICIYDKDSAAWCAYESLEAVLKNWVFHTVTSYDSNVTRDILTGKGLKPLY